MNKLAVAVLAGGQSRRMGQDKASLIHPRTGLPLWRHQLELARPLAPDESFLSANAQQRFPASETRALIDHSAEQGPLAGVVRCLEESASLHLLVLAVDMPAMSLEVIQPLLDAKKVGLGAVYRDAAIYQPFPLLLPRNALPHLARRLAEGERMLQTAIDHLRRQGLMRVLPFPQAQRSAFANLNSPEDWERARAEPP